MDFREQNRIFADLKIELAQIAATFGVKDSPIIELQWNGRFTRRMGDARVTSRGSLPAGRVRLSKPLYPHATPEKRRNTMVHEIAHIYAELEQPRVGHGPAWKKWMRRFGEDPQRYYEVNEATFADTVAVKSMRRRQTRFVRACNGCGHEITITKVMRTKWLRKRQTRLCAKCKSRLDWQWASGATEKRD